MIKLLTSPWMTAPVGVLVYLASTFLFWKTPTLPRPDPAAAKTTHLGASWEFNNPEADQLMAQLKEEKQALDLRKQQIDEMSARLDAEKAELAQTTQNVRQLQAEFDKAVVRVQEDETANLGKLAKVYADMSPETAASIMAEMDDVVIVKIMLFMKESETAGILETLAKKGQPEAKRAAAISERVRLSTANNSAAKKKPAK